MDPARLAATTAALLVLLAPPAEATAEEGAPEARENLVTASFTPVNMGRFTFRDDDGLAFEPNLRVAAGLTLAYHRLVVPGMILGGSMTYLHTMADYSGRSSSFDAEGGDDGVRGYADILRPAVEIGGLWKPTEERIDFVAKVALGPTVVWFEDMKMAGFFGAVSASATFWLSAWLGLHVSLGLSVDSIWAREVSGWAASELEGAAAYTVFIDVGVGLRARF